MGSSSSNNNQRIKTERSSGGDAMPPSAVNINYNKDSSSYNANAGSFNKNQLIANSFSANKQASSNMPAMSASMLSQKSGGQPTATDNLSYSNISSKDPSGFPSSMNKMRQQPPQQRGGAFPNQFDIKQEKSFKNLHSNKVMSTDTMTTLLSAPKPIQPYVQNMSNTGGSSSSSSSNSYRHMTNTQQQPALSNLQQHKSNLSIEPDLQPYKFVDDSIKSEASPKLGKPTSIFSPEWKEPAQQMSSASSSSSNRTSSSLSGSNKSTSNKHAVSVSSEKADINNSSKVNRSGFNQGNLLYDRQLNPKRFQDLSTINMQQFTNIPMADGSSSLLNNRLNKRPYVPEQQQQQHQHQHQPQHHHSQLDNKYDVDNNGSDMRETKVRKTDYFSTTTLDSTTTSNNDSRNNHLLLSPLIKLEKNSSTSKVSDLDNESFAKPLFASLSSSSSQASSSTLNSSGRSIETNADMVRNLLKESLCSSDSKYGGVPYNTNLDEDSKFSIKTEPLLSTDDIFNPGSLITSLHDTPAIEDMNHRIKVEKKKKKDKHKHKERSKDKEERKKHKKDKDRHKERGDGSGTTILPSDMVNDVNQKLPKITIPKDKLNFHSQMSASTTGFKIKIPKDRIKSDLTPNASSRTDSKPQQTSSLKIKISKDMIESYAHPKYD
jgi:cyclin T